MQELEIPLSNYLKQSLDNIKEDETLCKGWDFLKHNITPELKSILEKDDYWTLQYNDDKVRFILRYLGIDLEDNLKKQLGSFVYIYNQKRREEAEQKREQDILSKGYIKVFSQQKEYNNKKVIGIFNISKIGVLGSFDSLEEKEGTLKYSESYNTLMLIPKRSRTRGYIIRDFAFIKVA